MKKLWRTLGEKSGMTLLEAVLAMTLLVVIVSACGGLIVASMRAATGAMRSVEASAAGWAVVDHISEELRYATAVDVGGSGNNSIRVSGNKLEKLHNGSYMTVYDLSGFPNFELALDITQLDRNRITFRVDVLETSGETLFSGECPVSFLNNPKVRFGGDLPVRNPEIFYSVK